MKALLLFLFSLALSAQALAQVTIVEGPYSSEAAVIRSGNQSYLVLKEYMLPSVEGEDGKGIASYLDFGPDVVRAIVMGDAFRSVLLALDDDGQVLWQRELGVSGASWATAIAADPEGGIYAGEKNPDPSGGISSGVVTIRRFDEAGNELWSTKVDSLQFVDGIFADTSNQITVLGSFIAHNPVERDGELTLQQVTYYYTLRIDRRTGRLRSKAYDGIVTYLNTNGYAPPSVNDRWSYLTYNADSLVLVSNTDGQAVMLSEEKLKGLTIVGATSTTGRHDVLAMQPDEKSYRLVSERYAANKTEKAESADFKADAGHHSFWLMRNELGGVTVFLNHANRLEVLKYDDELDLEWRKNYELKEDLCDRVMAVGAAPDDGYVAYVIDADGKKRTISALSITSKGKMGE